MKTITTLFTCLLFAGSLLAQTQIKVMHYNVLNFGNACGGVTASQKYQWLKTILNNYRPDILTVNELSDQTAYVNGIKQLSFDYTNAVGNADFTNTTNSTIVNQLFYNTDVFGYKGVEVITGSLRDINVYELYLQPAISQPGTDTTFLTCIVAHLKAGQDQSDQTQRTNAANSIMSWINNFGAGKNILLMGDMNIYSANESAFQSFVFNANTAIRFRDPANKQGGWSGQGNAAFHTQSTRSNSNDCGAGGGMDDRFDMILANAAIMQGDAGVQYVSGTYAAFGNDGDSYNTELNCDGTPVPTSVCAALKQMSDHLPVVLELELSRAVSVEEELEPALAQLEYHADGQVILQVDANAQPTERQILLQDLSGKIVFSHRLSAQEKRFVLPQNQLSAGVYLLRLEGEAQSQFWREKVLLP